MKPAHRRKPPPLSSLDAKVLRALRDLCPHSGSGTTEITLSVAGEDKPPITLTGETRRRLDERLKARGGGR